MKKFLFASALLLTTALIAVSCGKDNPPDEPVQLSVNYTPADIPAEGGTATFTITCNADWTISNPNMWLVPDKTSGNGNAAITVTVAENTGAAREGTLSVKAGDKTATVTISQLKNGDAPVETTLSISYDPVDIPAEGGTATFSITCNADWNIQNPEAWLTPDKTSGNGDATVTVTVAANTGAARQGTLTVSAGDKTATVTVSQLESSVDPGDGNVVYSSGSTKEELFAAFNECTLIDKDGDGYNWSTAEFKDEDGRLTGDYGIVSRSWIKSPLTPENYLILPAQTIETDARFIVNFYATDSDWYLENFKLIVSDQPITSANCRDAEVIYDGILTTPDRTDYVGEIPASYNNGTVYLGVCHYNSTDQFNIVIQTMTLTHNGASPSPMPVVKPANTASSYSPAYKTK